jgi:hypothetical protein
VDIPFEAEGLDASRDCKNSDCVISAIKRFRTVMADTKQPSRNIFQFLRIMASAANDGFRS